MAWTLIILVFSLILVPRLIGVLLPEPKPVKGIYRLKGNWSFFKYWAFYVLFQLRQYQNKRKGNDGGNAGYGIRSRTNIEEMEKPQVLPKEHPQAVDAVYFNGANKDGFYFVGATARRHEKLTQTLLYIRVPGLGLLEIPSLPDTSLFRDDELSYAANGFKIHQIEPMKRWKLSYDGSMRLIKDNGENEDLRVDFDFDWIAGPGYFDFDTDMHTHAMCEAMSRETWSRSFFDKLKKLHQTHYEQFGELTGKLHIENQAEILFSVHGVRDHSYGNIRDWKMLHRYAIQYVTMADGRYICAGLICMPETFSRLPIGYVCQKDGTIDRLEWIDFEFYNDNCGDDGNAPDEFKFKFKAGNEVYDLRGTVIDTPIFYMGYEWEARIHERMCTFTINGAPGWGISEWDYRNRTGKPDIYKKKDTGKEKE